MTAHAPVSIDARMRSARLFTHALCISLLIALGSTGCTTPKAFEPSSDAVSILLAADNTVRIGGETVYRDTILTRLQEMGVADTARIVIHAHTSASSEVFRMINGILKEAGYKHIRYDTYNTPPE